MGSNSNREPDPIDSWMEVTLVYNSALKEIGTKLEILNDEFQQVHRYNPIEHIKSRMKTSESIVKKLKKKGYESTIENMVEHVNDIAGIRVICSFTSDIYRVAEMIGNQNDIRSYRSRTTSRIPRRADIRAITC
jgi:putative GTP pyrophosphokinase